MNMNKINQFLKRDNIQRRSYIALLLIWIFVFLNTNLRFYFYSGTDYLPLIFIFPVFLFVLQILFNNKIIWMGILVCTFTFALWKILMIYTYIVVDIHKEYNQEMEGDTSMVFKWIFGLVVFLGFIWFLFKIKPFKK